MGFDLCWGAPQEGGGRRGSRLGASLKACG